MPVSASDVVGLALDHTKAQLFRSFRFSQWWRLAVVGLLAGELGSSANCNFNVPANTRHTHSHFLGAAWPPSLHHPGAGIAGLVVVCVLLALALVVISIYIGSVMRFVLFDSVVAKNCRIRQGWRRRRTEGRRFFLWQISYLAASVAALCILIAPPVAFAWVHGWFAHARDNLARLILGGIALFSALFLLFALLSIINVLTKDFVVPQMALEGLTALEGWRRLLLWLKEEKGHFAGYIGLKIALDIAAVIVVAVVQVVALLVMLIPIGGIALAIYYHAKAAAWTWNTPVIALMVVLGTIAVLLIFSVLVAISTPIAVFFPAYSIYFFAPRYPLLAALLRPQPPPAHTFG